MATDLSSKRLEILKETLPKINGIAALWTPREGEWDAGYKEAEAAAKALSLRFHSVEFFTAEHLGPAFVEMAKARDSGFIVVLSPFVTLNSKRIVELALKYRLPGMYPTRQFAEEGGLMAYGPLVGDLYRRAATYVDKFSKVSNPLTCRSNSRQNSNL